MNNKNGRVLIVDDDADVLTAARLLLKQHFSLVDTLENPEQISAAMQRESYDVVLLDMNFTLGANNGKEGLYWLDQIHEIQPSALVVMMTAYGGVDTAVKAMKKGAADFILKPWENERLLATVNSVLSLKKSQDEIQYLRNREQEIQSAVNHSSIMGCSEAITRIRNMIDLVAPSDASILILGENGTGKEVIAHEIYQQSARADQIIITVDLGAVAETLFESELFGHKKGAFTGADNNRIGRFQAANGGTLFLDEIGNLPLHLQGKLLSVLEQRQVTPLGSNTPVDIDVRLICATNKSLDTMVNEGTFREDLYYRINTIEIQVPPLRERPDDIPEFIKHFVSLYADKYNISTPKISRAILNKASGYPWPGNVRELRHAIERALILSSTGTLELDQLIPAQHKKPATVPTKESENLNLNLHTVEFRTIKKALQKHAGNISRAANELGITRTSLYRRMDKYGL